MQHLASNYLIKYLIMNIYDVINILKTKFKPNASLWLIKKRSPDVYEFIINYKFNNDLDNFTCSEKLKYLKSGLLEPKRCEICNKPIKLSRRFCSRSCEVKYQHREKIIGFGLLSEEKRKEMNEKAKRTNLKKYGVENVLMLDEFKSKNLTKEAKEKRVKTLRESCLRKYGVDWPSKLEKHRQIVSKKLHDKTANENRIKAFQLKYGCDNFLKTNEFKTKYRTEEILKDNLIKGNKTKSINNSFKTSKEEQCIKVLLETKFENVRYQYTSNQYPFNCDFYIPSLDLYIEFQGHFSHGKINHVILGPYDKNNKQHEKVLNDWIQKSNKSKYYASAINVWTVRDPLKRETARKNNLNWMEFFTMDEFMAWYNSLD